MDKTKLRVFVKDSMDATSRPYILNRFSDINEAEATVRSARIANTNGVVWLEDENGNIIPVPTTDESQMPGMDWSY